MSEPSADPTRARSRALALETLWFTAIGVSAFALVLMLAHRAGALVYLPVSWDAWFDTDTTRVYEDVSQHTSVLNRGSYHPVFGLVGHGPYAVLAALLGTRGVGVVQIELALVSAALATAGAGLFRTIGCSRGEALVFTALASSSAAFVFFAGIPETFPFGALSIVAGLLAVARARDDRRSPWVVGALSALAAAITVTNALPIAAALWWRRRTLSLVRVAAVALVTLALGVTAQAWMFPRAPLGPLQMLGLGKTSIEQPDDVFTGDLVPPTSLAHVGRVLRVFLLHSAVMPEAQAVGIAPKLLTLVPSPLRVLSIQTAPLGFGDPWRMAAQAAWIALLSWAAVRFVRGPRSITGWIVASGVATQLALHAAIGRETFLYALHFQPLLVAFTATLVNGPKRRAAVALAAVAAVLGAVNNLRAFERVSARLADWGRPVDVTSFPVAARPEPVAFGARFRLPDLPLELAFERDNGEALEVRAVEELPGVWSIEVRPNEILGGGLMLDVAATHLDAPGRPPDLGWMVSSPKGEYAFLGHRWSILSRPGPSALKPFNRRNEACGLLTGPCLRMRFGKAKRWRFTVQDLLERPLWLGTALPWGDHAWQALRAAWRLDERASAPGSGEVPLAE